MSESPKHLATSRPEYNRRLAAKRKRQRRRRIRTGIITLLVLAVLIVGIVLICKSCSADRPIVGTWDYDSVTVYRFDKGGKGALELPNSTYEFSYKTVGDRLTIDFDSEFATDSSYTFTAKENKLTLVSVEDPDANYVLTKKQRDEKKRICSRCFGHCSRNICFFAIHDCDHAHNRSAGAKCL